MVLRREPGERSLDQGGSLRGHSEWELGWRRGCDEVACRVPTEDLQEEDG